MAFFQSTCIRYNILKRQPLDDTRDGMIYNFNLSFLSYFLIYTTVTCVQNIEFRVLFCADNLKTLIDIFEYII